MYRLQLLGQLFITPVSLPVLVPLRLGILPIQPANPLVFPLRLLGVHHIILVDQQVLLRQQYIIQVNQQAPRGQLHGRQHLILLSLRVFPQTLPGLQVSTPAYQPPQRGLQAMCRLSKIIL